MKTPIHFVNLEKKIKVGKQKRIIDYWSKRRFFGKRMSDRSRGHSFNYVKNERNLRKNRKKEYISQIYRK